jgi:hypothetical protein
MECRLDTLALILVSIVEYDSPDLLQVQQKHIDFLIRETGVKLKSKITDELPARFLARLHAYQGRILIDGPQLAQMCQLILDWTGRGISLSATTSALLSSSNFANILHKMGIMTTLEIALEINQRACRFIRNVIELARRLQSISSPLAPLKVISCKAAFKLLNGSEFCRASCRSGSIAVLTGTTTVDEEMGEKLLEGLECAVELPYFVRGLLGGLLEITLNVLADDSKTITNLSLFRTNSDMITLFS